MRTTGGLDTVGVRCPDHPVTLAIIEAAGVPIAAPSANTSGRPSCTTAQDVLEDMNGKIDAIVDGGPCAVGVESTILDLTVTPPQLLRPGGLPLEALEGVLGEMAVDQAVTGAAEATVKSPVPRDEVPPLCPSRPPVTVVTGDRRTDARLYPRADAGPALVSSALTSIAELFRRTALPTAWGRKRDKAEQAQRVFDALRDVRRTRT